MNPASPPPLRLAEIADRLGGALEGDPDLLIGGVAEPAEAGAEDIVILADKRRLRDLESSPAAAVVVGGPWEVGKPAVRVRDARLALAELLLRPVWVDPVRNFAVDLGGCPSCFAGVLGFDLSAE